MNLPKLRLLFQHKPVTVVLSLVLSAMIGFVDCVSGRELAVSALYLIPICGACWLAGRKAGLLLAAASALVWFIADWMDNYTYPHRAIPYWNAFMLLALYVTVVYLLSAFQTAHQQLCTANENLEATVQRRTSALQAEMTARQRLEIAKIQAERLAAVGTMAAELAHEVRNPLGSIALNLDLMQKEVENLAATSRHPPAEGQLLVHDIRAEIHRIQRVIDDYLQFARLPRAQRRPLSLNELLEEKLAFMNSDFERARVALHTDFDRGLPVLNADPEQLWQATLNLIRNSLEAMPTGGDLTVSTQRDNGKVLLRIADNGKGISQERLKQLFVPFFTTKTSGTGLGLTLVQQIAIEHGGHVECESAVGKGSTFTLFLPVTDD
jgi:signal transduction histidine kinase